MGSTQMKKSTLMITVLCVLGASPANAEERIYEIEPFTGIHVARGTTLEMSVGETLSAIATSDAISLGELVVEVEDGVLHVKRRSLIKENGYRGAIVKVTAPSLALNYIEVSTGSEADIKDLSIEDARVLVNTGSRAELAGSCGSIDAKITTGAELDAHDLLCEKVKVKARTGSSVDVFASDSVEAYARMGSEITVYGKPAKVKKGKFLGAEINIKK